jgi:DNA-binding winged helix-turn-helix (wHTH) protein/Tol biopolymer transport system component
MASLHVVYEFGEFHLGRDERALRRGSAPVALTPKATDILLALIDNRGQIVEKADLMQQVWPDIAVEEGNLSQNVYTLRRVLTDARGKCPFIETVPRRGYRFVGAVRVVHDAADEKVPVERPSHDVSSTASLATVPVALLPTSEASTDATVVASGRGPSSRRAAAWLVVVLATAVMGAAASWLSSDGASEAGTMAAITLPVTRLTHVGNVVRATISRDGRSLVYAVTTGSRESLWAKNLDSGKVTQLIEPAVGTYRRGGGLSSGPDGSVYYTWFRPDLASVGIFRIRQDGEGPEPMTGVRDLPAFDPQGTRFACITTFSMPFGESRLLVYEAGQSPRAVAMRSRPMTFLQMRPAWSPDGRQLAAWTSSEREPGVRTLVVVGVDDGRERVVTRKLLHAIDGMVWLPDGASVVVAAREAASAPLRLWQIALGSGAMRPLSTDISDYLLAGLTGGGKQLAAVRVDVGRNMWMAPLADLSRAQQIGSDAGELSELESLAWLPDGRIAYTSTESGNADIWLYDPAKDARRQLTTNARDDFNPATAPDGRTIVFASDRFGATGLWTISEGGESSARQLTSGGDSRPAVAPDGAVVFQRGTIQSAPIDLWRLPPDGGAPVRLAEGVAIRPAVSPDGRLVAYYWLTAERWTPAVVPMNGGQPLQIFPLSSTHCGRTVRWSRDSKALAYIDCDGGVGNIWLHQLDGSSPRRLTDFRSGHITTFDWTRDGSRLAWITRNQVSDVVLSDVPPPLPPS